jgi:spore coat protein U-like protein
MSRKLTLLDVIENEVELSESAPEVIRDFEEYNVYDKSERSGLIDKAKKYFNRGYEAEEDIELGLRRRYVPKHVLEEAETTLYDSSAIDATETTALLETSAVETSAAAVTGAASGVTSGAASSLLPGIVTTGILTVGGVAYGAHELKKGNPVHVSGSNYAGPGTKDFDAPEKGTVDIIARDHDISYKKAESPADVLRSDKKALGDFTADYIKSADIRSGISAAGLGIKHGVETLLNKVIYPNMPRNTLTADQKRRIYYLTTNRITKYYRNAGEFRFAIQQKAAAWERHGGNKAEYIQATYASLQQRFRQAGLDPKDYIHQTWWLANLPNPTTENPRDWLDDIVENHADILDVQAFEDSFSEDVETNIEPPSVRPGAPTQPVASTSGVKRPSATNLQEPPTKMGHTLRDDPMTGKRTEMAPGAAGGSSDAPSDNTIKIGYKGFKMEGNKIFYSHATRQRIWGGQLKINSIENTTTSLAQNSIVYPYSDQQTQYIWRYIPEGLFTSLLTLPNCKPCFVRMKVIPIGATVSFGTNTTLTGSGTTHHILYGMGHTGLNKVLPTKTAYCSIDSEMVVTENAITGTNVADDWIKKLWGSSLTNAAIGNKANVDAIAISATNHRIIFPNTFLKINVPQPKPASATQLAIDAAFSNSFFNIPKYWQMIQMRNWEGQVLTDMHFEYPWPILSSANATSIYVMGPAAKGMEVARTGTRKRMKFSANNLNFSQFTTNQTSIDRGVTVVKPYQTNSYKTCSLNTKAPANPMCFEKLQVGSMVPSVHFGIEAVQANVPGSTNSFIQASADFYVETEIGFEFNANHDFQFESFKLDMAMAHANAFGDCTLTDSYSNFNEVSRYGQVLVPDN